MLNRPASWPAPSSPRWESSSPPPKSPARSKEGRPASLTAGCTRPAGGLAQGRRHPVPVFSFGRAQLRVTRSPPTSQAVPCDREFVESDSACAGSTALTGCGCRASFCVQTPRKPDRSRNDGGLLVHFDEFGAQRKWFPRIARLMMIARWLSLAAAVGKVEADSRSTVAP